ncbi:MAG: TetR/AcrR family transcriptional regulator [Bacteroidota bacterium]
MGRKPLNKARKKDPETQANWVAMLSPHFLDGSLSKATIQEIADILSVSKATLYKHFSSKQEILEAVVSTRVEKIIQCSQVLQKKEIPYRDRLEESVSMIIESLAGISNQFLFDLKNWHPNLWMMVEQLHQAVITDLEVFYQEGKKSGILNDLDTRLLALTDLVFIRNFSDPQFLMDNQLNLESAISGYFKLKKEGLFKSNHSDE